MARRCPAALWCPKPLVRAVRYEDGIDCVLRAVVGSPDADPPRLARALRGYAGADGRNQHAQG